MKFQKKSISIMILLLISMTTSRAADALWRSYDDGPSREIVDNSRKKIFNEPQFFTDDRKDDSSEVPISQNLLFNNDHTNQQVEDSTEGTAITLDDSETDLNSFIMLKHIRINLGSMDSPIQDEAEPDIIHIQPEPKITSVHVREFHECVSCNFDDGARKDYNQCMKELTIKNYEIASSCCNISFDREFCVKASTGKIDYETVCQDPKKALSVGDCFWMKIENKDADDIKKYRECKKTILDRYCTVKSSLDTPLRVKHFEKNHVKNIQG